MNSVQTACVRAGSTIATSMVISAWFLGLLIACETGSCSAWGKGTAWELNGPHPVEKAAAAQPKPVPPAKSDTPHAQPVVPPQPDPRMATLAKLAHQVTVEWKDEPLENALAFIQAETGVDMMVMWIDEDNPALGLRKERRISLVAKDQDVIDLLEKITERADTRAKGDGSTWQISDTGTLQVGPRERLNKWTRTCAYDVADLLQVIVDWIDPDDGLMFNDSHPFTSAHRRWRDAGFMDTRHAEDKAQELRGVIVATCEPKAWTDNGGDAASILYQRGSRALVVRAPDYVHRAIDGYHPSRPPQSSVPTPTPEPREAKPAKAPARTTGG